MAILDKLKEILSTFYSRISNSKAGRSGLIYTATNFFNAALPFLLLPVLTEELTEAEYGIVAMILVVVSVVTPLMTVGVTGAISRAYFREEIADFPAYIGNTLYIVLAGFLTVTAAFFAGEGFLSSFTGIPQPWLFACIFIALGDFLIAINLVTYRVKFEAKKFAAIKISQTILLFGITFLLVVGYDFDWRGVIIARLVVLFLFSGVSIFELVRNRLLKFKINRTYIRNALLFGVPLLPHLLSGFIVNTSDRIFITNILDVSRTGTYSVAYQIGSVIDLISNSFNLAWSPWLFMKLKDFNKNYSIIKKATNFSLIGLFGLAFLFLLTVPVILEFFVSDDFQVSRWVISIVALGFVFQGYYLLFVTYLFYQGNTKLISIITISIALVNLILNYIMIHRYGVIGAAITTAVCFLLKFLIIFSVANKKYKLYFYD